ILTQRRTLRWLTWTAVVLALAAVLLWLAAAPLIGLVLERQLRRAGYAEPSAVGVSLAYSGVVIDRLELAPANAFVVDGLRVQVGANGVRSIAIDRLRLEAEVTADGELKLPGYASAGNGKLPLDL